MENNHRRRVKIFSRGFSDTPEKLEAEVNDWLTANPQHDVEQVIQSSTSWVLDRAIINVTITVVYYHRDK